METNLQNLPLLKHILALPKLGQICTVSLLQPFTIERFQLEHLVIHQNWFHVKSYQNQKSFYLENIPWNHFELWYIGDPFERSQKEMAVALKLGIFDLILMESKCVWEAEVFREIKIELIQLFVYNFFCLLFYSAFPIANYGNVFRLYGITYENEYASSVQIYHHRSSG